MGKKTNKRKTNKTQVGATQERNFLKTETKRKTFTKSQEIILE